MSALARWWFPAAPRWPWQRPIDLESDHGHRPYAAWEAELSAYARLRAGLPVDVTFGFVTSAEWRNVIHLARPPARVPAASAFRLAELDLEHLLMHYRQGTRELALYWHTWRHPSDPVRLPWPPWDEVDLPGRLARQALIQAVPGLEMPASGDVWPGRHRDAALWIASAWADGVHRAREIAERPGMAQRLPTPPAATTNAPLPQLLHALASGASGTSNTLANDALAMLLAADANDPEQHTRAILQAVALLASRGALPPGHRQRPAWLHPFWGRWRHAVAVQRILAEFARSPTSAEIAAATARARSGRSLALPSGTLGSLLSRKEPAAAARRERGDATSDSTRQHAVEEEPDDDTEWGPGTELPSGTKAGPLHGDRAASEGQGHDGPFGFGSGGAGPGTLGALHVIDPAPADRSAYWQLRGALAPQIERLIERLRATSDQDEAAVPRRFQRSGRIDRNRLPAALAGRETVFSRYVHRPQPAHALCLLLDCSASMTMRAEQLREVAILVESAAAAVGAQVSAFLFGPGWERLEPPGSGAPLVALGRELHPHGGTPFGPAVAVAAEWLALQPFRQKRLWVISDGQWSARDRAEGMWRPDLLKDVVVWILAEAAPEPPHAAMRVVAVPTLDDLVQLAPIYFWPDRLGRLSV